MRPAPLGPRAGLPAEMAIPLTIIALLWGVAGLAGLAWASAATAAWATHAGRWDPPPFTLDTAADVARRGPGPVFGASTWLVTGIWMLLGLGLAVAGGLAASRGARRPPSDDPVRSMAQPTDLRVLTPAGATARARALRASLPTNGPIPAAECGVALGRLRPSGVPLRGSWEDVLLAIMAPRAGKTTSLAVPIILDAPGAVIATSNKADLVMATHAARRTRGRCWVFDPQGIAHTPRRFTFNPLAGVHTVEAASRLAGHFIAEIADRRKGADFWIKAAGDVLTGLILAAALDGRDLAEVFRWLNDSAARRPVQLLHQHGHPALAASLEGRQAGAVETREGIYETARTAAQSLRDRRIMAWVTPDPTLPAFHPETFIASDADTVYAMSKDGGGSAAPLVAALVDALFIAGQRRAEAAAGRLDPPLVAVLDEAANVAKISDLPELYSHLGSRGLIPVTILQSYQQGVGVWGDGQMGILWGAATIKLIGAGIDDPKLADDISKLVGEHDVTVRSISDGRNPSASHSLRRQRILPPEAIRALPRGQALLLATGTRPALLDLQPWYTGPHAAAITAAVQQATARITDRARDVAQAAAAEAVAEGRAIAPPDDPTAQSAPTDYARAPQHEEQDPATPTATTRGGTP